MSPVMEYPEDLNPFGDDEEPKEETEPETPKIKTPGKSTLHSVLFEQLWGHAVHSGRVQKNGGCALYKRDRQDCQKTKVDNIQI